MESKKPVEPLDELEFDVPTTPEDNEMLWRVRELNTMTPQQYLAFLLELTKGLPQSRETNRDTDEPFTL
ncbi:MAG: hypothetical protein JO197_21945 [Acidobacteria bacterium]|nr:hypothetical protein [Acidobacteriota bacterium]MBV9474798.1 hypothetical protein [Acidobacteriota bacterium]